MKMTLLAVCGECVKMSVTNCFDVEITKAIMTGTVMIAAICVGGYIVVKLIDACFKSCQERKWRKWDDVDKDRKRRAELLERKLEMMKKLCYEESVKRVEFHDEEKTEKYVDVLKPVDYGNEANDINKYFKEIDAEIIK